MSVEDKQLAKDLIIDFRTDPLSSLRQDVYRVMPVKSVSDVRQELEDAICEEVRGKVAQAASGTRAGGPLGIGDYCSHGGSAFRSRKDGTSMKGWYPEHLPEQSLVPRDQDHAASQRFGQASWRELKSDRKLSETNIALSSRLSET